MAGLYHCYAGEYDEESKTRWYYITTALTIYIISFLMSVFWIIIPMVSLSYMPAFIDVAIVRLPFWAAFFCMLGPCASFAH